MLPASNLFNLNTTDFELFMIIAEHQKTGINLAVNLMQIVSEVGRKHIVFTRASLKLMLTLLGRFENYNEMFYAMQFIVQSNMRILYSQDNEKVQMYNKLKGQIP